MAVLMAVLLAGLMGSKMAWRVVVGWAGRLGYTLEKLMVLMLDPSAAAKRVWLRADMKAGHSGLRMAAMMASEAVVKTVWKVALTKDAR